MLDQVPIDIRKAVENYWRDAVLIDFFPVAGGCINNGGKLTTSKGSCFLKWNDRKSFPQMFEKESRGLKLLRDSATVRISEVLGYGEASDFQFIILEWVETGPPKEDYWAKLGVQLASMHACTSTGFGLDHDNYIGSLKQDNHLTGSWCKFLVERRLQPQIEISRKLNKPITSLQRKIERLYPRIPELLPEGTPSLLHGDLWDGNLLTDLNGNACLIDPAVYFGHREIELAYTKLFGKFDREFYDAYEASARLDPGFNERVPLYNLYPLLVHVNLFGGAYIQKAEAVVDRYS